jgi:hypothetical protein
MVQKKVAPWVGVLGGMMAARMADLLDNELVGLSAVRLATQ